ncbi:MAG: YicC/YloC family endoribonuclease [Candidatus Omnitrophota bacterium]|nr:YicC/YloC family endoribonuclease [Candidatus Omnitrophota bacterium]
MTAFARSTALGKGNWSVEIRSLNHRYFEFSAKLPQFLYPVERRIKDLVQSKMRRGKVTLSISQEGAEEADKEFVLDEKAVRYYRSAMKKLRQEFGLEADVSVRDLMALPKIFKIDKPQADPEKIWVDLKKVLNQTLANALKLKETEGRKLAVDVSKRLGFISATVNKVEKRVSGNTEFYFKKLRERLGKILKDSNIDSERVYREAALLAERSDVTEEIVRLKGHLDYFKKRLKDTQEVGRELDFICQEMHREINTLGVKSQVLEVSSQVVFVKKELEKIREQIQNVE